MLFITVTGILYLSLKSNLLDDAVPREKLSSTINSEYQEVRPLISPDGNTLYFSRRYHPENTGGPRDYQDIWVSHLEDGRWSEPEKLDEPLNNKKTNTLCSITSDGRYALLLDSYKKVKTPLVQAFDSPAGWGAPGELEIRNFLNHSRYYDFYYLEQSEVLLSAIDDGGGSGGQDLHVSFKHEDGSYSKPQNLGPTVNTDQDDFAPFMAADGKALYFASFGHGGLGGSDFFVSYRLDNSWKRWTNPKNLGAEINSEHDENYLSITGDFKYVYFESYPKGANEKDIYRAQLPGQFHPQNLAPALNESEVVAEAGEPGTTGKDDEFEPPPPQTTEINPGIQSLGSLDVRRYLDGGQVQSRVLRNNYFPYNSYELSPQSLTKLKEIARILQGNAQMEAQLEGHADNRGPEEGNLRISYLRALAAAHYLIDQGISGNRLQVTGSGESEPLASNDDEKDGRELNRRVEITLVSPAEAYRFTIYH